MLTQYQIDTTNVFFATNRQTDLDNFHSTLLGNIRRGYGYTHIESIDQNTIVLHFSKHIGCSSGESVCGELLVEAITEITNAYSKASFETLKHERIEMIDTKTRDLISNGAVFDGHTFSLSDNAQRNWIATKASIDVYDALNAWPVPITTLDDGIYLLHNATHIVQFTTTMLFVVAKYYNSGRTLKLQIKAATTKAEVDAVIDSRH